MRETIGEAGPAVDFREQLGDAQTRQHGVEAANDRVGLLVLRLANRTDRQAFLGERGLGQFPGSGESIDLVKARVQTFGLFIAPVLETIGNGKAQFACFPAVLESVARQEKVVESAESAAADEPGVSSRRSHESPAPRRAQRVTDRCLSTIGKRKRRE